MQPLLMTGFLQTAIGWVAAIFLLGVILFLHEFGHYIMSVLNGVKVEEFGFGFPPRLLKLFTWRGTLFSLNWIPFGAYVRPAGEDDPSIPGGLSAASARVRAMVLLGGVLMNLIVGMAAFTISAKIAYPESSVVLIQQVVADSPAGKAGLMPGDHIVAADDLAISDSSVLIDYIHAHLGQDVSLQIKRGDTTFRTHVTPRTVTLPDQGPTGVVLQQEYIFSDRHSWGESFVLAMKTIYGQLDMLAHLPKMLIDGEISLAQGRPIGPVGIVDVTQQVITVAEQQSQWAIILNWMGAVNIALAIGNLLPIPAVDGGRLMFLIWEVISRRPIRRELEQSMIVYTMLLLLACMGVITMLDIFYPVLPR